MTLCPALCWALGTERIKTQSLALMPTARRGERICSDSGIKEGFPGEGPFELGIKG